MDKKNISKTYFVSAFYWKNYNAASKAKMDVERILQSLSLEPLDLFKDMGNIRVFSIFKLFALIFKSLFTNRYKYSNVVFQNGTGIDIILAPILKFLFRHGKRILVIHDVESLRYNRKIDYLREKIVFSSFTHIICHSGNMKEFLEKKFNVKSKNYVLGFFDYLVSENILAQVKERSFPNDQIFSIIFAGKLSDWKSGFLRILVQDYKPPKNYKLLLYGKGYDGPQDNSFIQVNGAYPPDELPAHLNGHFGLIWDGNEVHKIGGSVGEYLKYNSPHKASLYVVSSLPIIAWRESAIYKLIEKYNLGIGIESLTELDDVLSKVTKEQYDTWKSNVRKLREILVKGDNLRNIIQSILSE